MLEVLRQKQFDVTALHHAEAILEHDMPQALVDLEAVLSAAEIPIEELVRGGGGEAPFTQRLRSGLTRLGWPKHKFEIRRIVDGVETESISHEVDHVKTFGASAFALEIEWNNKDPFFDRDLDNFKRLHADGVISVGAIITRGESLQARLRELVRQFAEDRGINSLEDLQEYYSPTQRQQKNIGVAVKREASFPGGWSHAFVGDKFGESTTHWRKLTDRVDRGVGNPCPLLLIGLPANIVVA